MARVLFCHPRTLAAVLGDPTRTLVHDREAFRATAGIVIHANAFCPEFEPKPPTPSWPRRVYLREPRRSRLFWEIDDSNLRRFSF